MSVAEPLQPVESATEQSGRPHLELVPSVPDLDDPAANEEADESEVVPASEEVDLLRTYVRQIGNGRLLTAQEESLLAKRPDGFHRRGGASRCSSSSVRNDNQDSAILEVGLGERICYHSPDLRL